MEIFLLLFVVVFVIMIYSRQNSLDAKIQQLIKEISLLKRITNEIKKPVEIVKEQTSVVEEPKPYVSRLITPVVENKAIEEDIIIPPVTPTVIETQDTAENILIPPVIHNELKEEESIVENAPYYNYKKTEPLYEEAGDIFDPIRKYFIKNPDIEKFIGENLINKIGIAVLILGISFFVKYAIDNNWINESGRVLIGFVCGLMLAGFAHRLRDKFRSFSSVLIAGSLTVFYFTTAFAFHEYHLWSQSLTFTVMVIITALAVSLSLFYNRMELIIMATIGGFITPFLVSNGSGNYIALFSYLIILNIGLIIIAYFKEWRIVHFIAFVFTQLIYIIWLQNYSDISSFPFKGAFVFATIFYALFFITNIILQLTHTGQRRAYDYIVLISQNLVYYSCGMYIISQSHQDNLKGLFTASLGLINLMTTLVFLKNKKIDKVYLLLLTGVTLTYFTLAVPVQFDGHYITMFWGMEMIILLYLYQRSFISLLKIVSIITGVLMLGSLVYNLSIIYGSEFTISYKPIINKAFVTASFAAISLVIYNRFLNKEADTFFIKDFRTETLRITVTFLSLIIFFIAGFAEVSFQFINHFPDTELYIIYQAIYSFAFLFTLFFIIKKQIKWITSSIKTFLIAAFLLLYITQTQIIYNTFIKIMYENNLKLHYIALLASDTIIIVTLWKLIIHLKNNVFSNSNDDKFTYVVIATISLLFSIIGQHIFIQIYHPLFAQLSYAENLYQKAGLTIIWSVISFIVIRYGMVNNYKPLRVSALALFALSLLKLFIYDISNIPPAGKIIAFILLGVVLLIVSFMYQKIKLIVFKDDEGKDE